MRYIYFLLITFCSSHSITGTDSGAHVKHGTWDGKRYYIARYYLPIKGIWRPFDDIAPLNIRKCLFQQHTGLPFVKGYPMTEASSDD